MQLNSRIIKVSLCLLLLLSLFGCKTKNNNNANDKYIYIIESIKNNDKFASDSEYYDINVQMAKINDGYRYYVTIDNPRISMYDIEVLAIEKDSDYDVTMAASAGIFDEKEYNLIPNQHNSKDGFYKGVIISGTCSNPETILYIYVKYSSYDYSQVYNEYISLDAIYEN